MFGKEVQGIPWFSLFPKRLVEDALSTITEQMQKHQSILWRNRVEATSVVCRESNVLVLSYSAVTQ